MGRIDRFMPIIDFSGDFPPRPTADRPTGPEFFSLEVREARRFYLDLSPPATRPAAVVCGGREHCTPHYAIDRPSFPYFSVEWVTRGKGSLTLAGRDYPLVPGTVFSYGPGVPHHITSSPSDPLVKCFVDFTGCRAGELLRQAALPPGSCGRAFAPAEIEDLFDDLIENGLKNTRFSVRICDVLLEHLLLAIAELLVPGQSAPGPAYATYQRCRQHVQAHYVELRTLAQIARQCHVDPAYLCRLFRRYDHQSPYQFLLRLKMNLAAGRLQDPGTLVKQVAAELGFADAGHFCRAFKGVFGLSPEAFRRLR
jgi:AraC-like DNA-binding protein